MMRAGVTLTALVALVACGGAPASIPMTSPAAQAMLAQPLPEYAAKLRIARQISVSCDRYAFSDQTQVALSAARPDIAGGRLEAIRQSPGIELATDVASRSFEVKHGVEFGVDDLCAAGDREVAEQSGISALLVAV